MPRGNLDWPARLERTDESFRSHPSPRPSPRWYVFSGRRSVPHGVPALAGRATEVLGYWAWPEAQPAKAGTPCIERRGHAKHIPPLRGEGVAVDARWSSGVCRRVHAVLEFRRGADLAGTN